MATTEETVAPSGEGGASVEEAPERVVREAYATVWGVLAERLDLPREGTPRERQAAAAAAGLDGEALAHLRRLTGCYERAAFGPEPVDPETAAWAEQVAAAFARSTGRGE